MSSGKFTRLETQRGSQSEADGVGGALGLCVCHQDFIVSVRTLKTSLHPSSSTPFLLLVLLLHLLL